MTEELSLRLAAILLLGIAGQWLAWRFRVPPILVLLCFGIIAGPVSGFLDPSHDLGAVLLPSVSLAVAIVLFEGGLTLRLGELPQDARVIGLLLTAGALITLVVAALSAHFLLDMPARVALLLGAILIVTGPTVIGPLLEFVRPTRRVRVILKWEGIVIDPIGAMLALLVFEAVALEDINTAATQSILGMLKTVVWGGVSGAVGAGVLIVFLARYWIPDHLQTTFVLMTVVAAAVCANELQPESGLLAATLMGVVLANQTVVPMNHIVEFKENLRVLLIGGLFIVLGADLDLGALGDLGWKAIVFLGLLILFARPLGVALATLRSTLSWQERVVMAWVAPRGIVAAAVSSVFALRLSEAAEPGWEFLVPVTFLVIIGTIVVYGLSVAPLARALGVSESAPEGVLFIGAHPWAAALADAVKSQEIDVLLIDSNPNHISDAWRLGLPAVLGNVLSEAAREDLDLRGIGHLFAATPNDGVNALAVQRFKPVLGGANVFQIAPRQRVAGPLGGMSRELQGRVIANESVTFAIIDECWKTKPVVEVVPLDAAVDLDVITDIDGKLYLPLMVVTQQKRLVILSADRRYAASPGDKLIALDGQAASQSALAVAAQAE